MWKIDPLLANNGQKGKKIATVFPQIVSAETIIFWIQPYVLWPLITVHTGAETIQGRKIFKGGNYSRKYGMCCFLMMITKTLVNLLFKLWTCGISFQWNIKTYSDHTLSSIDTGNLPFPSSSSSGTLDLIYTLYFFSIM